MVFSYLCNTGKTICEVHIAKGVAMCAVIAMIDLLDLIDLDPI